MRPRLTTYRPSPTTVSYTVSTASALSTPSSRALHHALFALRIVLGLFTLGCLFLRIFPTNIDYLNPLTDYMRAQPWSHCTAFALVGGFLVFRRYHTEESLLVLRTLGIQTCTRSSSYLIPSTVRFIPTSQIRDIFIHEAFKGFEVRYYLAVVVEREPEVVVVFPVRCILYISCQYCLD